MKKTIEKALMIIDIMEKQKVSPRIFAEYNMSLFEDCSKRELIAPESRYSNEYSEKAYVFMIGSYIYRKVYKKPVTWNERKRFAMFPVYNEFFSRTVCASTANRIASLELLKRTLKKF